MLLSTPLLSFRTVGAAWITFLIAGNVCVASGQVTEDILRPPMFKTDASVVLVPATVLDRRGGLVGGLPSGSFVVTQDNMPRPIVSFGEEDVPLSVAIVLDTSGSMSPVLGDAKDTLRAFLNISNPEDEACLFTVSSMPNKASDFTRDVDTMLGKTLFSNAGGSTALIDTVYAGLNQMRSASHPRRAILVISDGMDNHSRYTARELMAAAVEADLQIYSVSIYDPPRNKKPIELQEERNGMSFLEELTRRTGGVRITVRDRTEITDAVTRIGRIMRDQYVIGFVPNPAGNSGKWHSIKVSVTTAGTKAYARSGFYGK